MSKQGDGPNDDGAREDQVQGEEQKNKVMEIVAALQTEMNEKRVSRERFRQHRRQKAFVSQLKNLSDQLVVERTKDMNKPDGDALSRKELKQIATKLRKERVTKEMAKQDGDALSRDELRRISAELLVGASREFKSPIVTELDLRSPRKHNSIFEGFFSLQSFSHDDAEPILSVAPRLPDPLPEPVKPEPVPKEHKPTVEIKKPQRKIKQLPPEPEFETGGEEYELDIFVKYLSQQEENFELGLYGAEKSLLDATSMNGADWLDDFVEERLDQFMEVLAAKAAAEDGDLDEFVEEWLAEFGGDLEEQTKEIEDEDIRRVKEQEAYVKVTDWISDALNVLFQDDEDDASDDGIALEPTNDNSSKIDEGWLPWP